MKINDPSAGALSASKLNQTPMTGVSSRGGRPGGTSGSGDDQVQLSSLASMMQSLASDSPDRTARIQQLAFQVQSGNYHVDAAQLSSSMVSAALRGY